MIKHIKKLHKYSDALRVMGLCALIALGSVVGNNILFADEAEPNTLTITAPSDGEGPYDVEVFIKEEIGTYVYGINIDIDGTTAHYGQTANYPTDNGWASEVSFELVSGGSTKISVISNGLNTTPSYKAYVKVTSQSDETVALSETEVTLSSTQGADVSISLDTSSGGGGSTAGGGSNEDTFIGNGGSYDWSYLLSNYNVISNENVSAAHIVGAILANGAAYHVTGADYITGEYSGSASTNMSFSDYSRGNSSFVRYFYGSSGSPNIIADYGFDIERATKLGTTFTTPYFYTRSSGGIEVVDKGNDNWHQFYLNYTDDNGYHSIKTPNASGAGYTYLNDEYVDFGSLFSSVASYSKSILTQSSPDGTASIVIDSLDDLVRVSDGSTTDYGTAGIYQLNAEPYKNYIITAEMGKEIEIINYVNDNFSNDDGNTTIPPTIISYQGTSLATQQVNIDGTVETFSIFPRTLVNGEQIEIDSGDGHEYGEYGNQLVYNFPNLTGKFTFDTQQNVPGHIIAPNADFYNVTLSKSGDIATITAWSGGNINGCTIVNSFLAGSLETHMFAYEGYDVPEETEIRVGIDGIKDLVGGNIADYDGVFKFELTSVEGNSSGCTMPTDNSATNNSSGSFNFSSIVFSEVGTYNFKVYEVIPDEKDPTITYDTTVYNVKIVISKSDGKFSYVKTVTKEDGTALGEITFTNKVESKPTEISIDIDGLKYLKNASLADFSFDFVLKYVGSNDAFTMEDKTATTDAFGSFKFDSIVFEEEGTYEFEVSEVTSGYEGYDKIEFDQSVYKVVVEVIEKDGAFASTTTITKIKDVNGDESNDSSDVIEFTNTYLYDDFVLPNTGGMGVMPFYLVGIMFIGFTIVLMKKEREERGGE